ncbi:hypothetical protein ACLOJK_019157 [Asimina triloba]
MAARCLDLMVLLVGHCFCTARMRFSCWLGVCSMITVVDEIDLGCHKFIKDASDFEGGSARFGCDVRMGFFDGSLMLPLADAQNRSWMEVLPIDHARFGSG